MLEDITLLIEKDLVKSVVPDGRPILAVGRIREGTFDQNKKKLQPLREHAKVMKEAIEYEHKERKLNSVAYALGNCIDNKHPGWPLETIHFAVQFFRSYKLKWRER